MLNEAKLTEAILWACTTEVSSPKPGNVNSFSDGHNMSVQQFIDSAHAIAPILSKPEQTVGEMILNAVKATRNVVDCNTNLGIILLFAPLCKAIQQCKASKDLRPELEITLNNLDQQDAEKTYQAIRLAEAGGLGQSPEQDISTKPTVTLKQAMALAENRDMIAQQYGNSYHEIFEIAYPYLTTAINCGESIEWATAFAYLKVLSVMPDSLVLRKQGQACATKVMDKAKEVVEKAQKNNNLSDFEADILLWDKELKKRAINPGTTADLTATILLIYAFNQACS